MISIIVAVAKNRVIGKNGDIPWHLPDDLRHFAKITKGHTVIMGRKTYESIVNRLGKALSERKSYVITMQGSYKAPGCIILTSIDDAIWTFSSTAEEVFVIGGKEIYEQFLPIADKLYITEININCDGDVRFPKYDHNRWRMVKKEHHPKDEFHEHEFDFIEWVRSE